MNADADRTIRWRLQVVMPDAQCLLAKTGQKLQMTAGVQACAVNMIATVQVYHCQNVSNAG